MTAWVGHHGLPDSTTRRRGAPSVGDPTREALDGLLALAVGLIGGGVLLVGCADRTVSVPMPTPSVPVALAAAVPIPMSPIPRIKPAVPPLPFTAAAAASVPRSRHVGGASEDVAIRMPDKPFALDPDTLVGLSEREMVGLLGQPVWVEETPPAKTWQYANARCRLRVFLFMEMSTRDFRTLSYELTSTDGQPDVAQQCFAELVAQAWAP